MPLIEERIAAIPSLREKYRVLSEQDVLAGIAVARIMFPAGSSPAGQMMASMDVSSADYDLVRAWLRQLDLHGLATVIWISERDGIEIDYADFITYFDDFWYPGDDVWAISNDGNTILDMDHEEILSLYQRKPG
jgi:hypothetical protein